MKTTIDLILKDQNLWGEDLNAIPGFANQVIAAINDLKNIGAENILRNLLSEKLAHA